MRDVVCVRVRAYRHGLRASEGNILALSGDLSYIALDYTATQCEQNICVKELCAVCLCRLHQKPLQNCTDFHSVFFFFLRRTTFLASDE